MSISPREISTKIRAKLSKLSRIFSTQDIRVNPEYLEGQDYFNSNYLIQGNDEDKIRKILDQAIQDRIKRVQKFEMRVDFDGAYIEKPLYAFADDFNRFEPLFISLVDIAIDIVEKIEGLEEDIQYGKPVSKDELIS